MYKRNPSGGRSFFRRIPKSAKGVRYDRLNPPVSLNKSLNTISFIFYLFSYKRWIGTDCEDGELQRDFHVADMQEMQKFSTIFYDVIGRGFNDYHLWLSLFERPKFSKYVFLFFYFFYFAVTLSNL